MIRLAASGDFSFFPGAQEGQWLLREGPGGAKELEVKAIPFVIGRALDCDLRLPQSEALAKTTSRWHSFIGEAPTGMMVADGSLRPMPDTGKHKPSISGTWVDGIRIALPVLVRPGMKLALGPWKFEFRMPEGPKVDIDGMLKSIVQQPSRRMDADDAGAAQAFAQLHGLFRKIEKAADAQEALQTVLAFALSRIKNAVVAAVLEEGPDGAVTVRSALHREAGAMPDFRFSSGLLKGLPADRSVLLESAKADLTESQAAQSISSGLVVPLTSRQGRMGFLYMDNRSAAGSFTASDLQLAYALANVVSLQLSNERQAFLSRLEQNMRQYFGPDVVRFIVKASREGKPLGLGVRRCEATILFVDLQGFSAFCRERSPEEVSQLLTPYYKLVSECVQAHGGHVDKFLGDGVMAVFGTAPLADKRAAGPDHALAAARCAREVMVSWAEGSLSQWRMRVSLRAGLHTGTVVAGNIGFSGRLEYSALGDAVNLASRMEKFARPNAIAMSDETRSRVAAEFTCEDGGLQEVHGFGPMRIWHLA